MKIRSFKDNEGVEWKLNVTAGNLLRACRGTGLTLSEITSMDIKVETLIEAVPFFCHKQLKERTVSHEEFLDRIGMDEIENIMTSLFPSVTEAFPPAIEGEDTDSTVPLSPGTAPTS